MLLQHEQAASGRLAEWQDLAQEARQAGHCASGADPAPVWSHLDLDASAAPSGRRAQRS
jgi:hypothetical protein